MESEDAKAFARIAAVVAAADLGKAISDSIVAADIAAAAAQDSARKAAYVQIAIIKATAMGLKAKNIAIEKNEK